MNVALLRFVLGLPLNIQFPGGDLDQTFWLVLHQRAILRKSRRGVTLESALLKVARPRPDWIYERATLRQDGGHGVGVLLEIAWLVVILVVLLSEVHA